MSRALPWSCYRCGRSFVHARYLADHLVTMHVELARLGRETRFKEETENAPSTPE